MLAALKRYFGFDSFRPGQEEAVGAVISGRDVMAVMPTGGGKSVCYQLPAARPGTFTLVVTPLRALMRDQVRHLAITRHTRRAHRLRPGREGTRRGVRARPVRRTAHPLRRTRTPARARLRRLQPPHPHQPARRRRGALRAALGIGLPTQLHAHRRIHRLPVPAPRDHGADRHRKPDAGRGDPRTPAPGRPRDGHDRRGPAEPAPHGGPRQARANASRP